VRGDRGREGGRLKEKEEEREMKQVQQEKFGKGKRRMWMMKKV
jgi:hypothetical protein